MALRVTSDGSSAGPIRDDATDVSTDSTAAIDAVDSIAYHGAWNRSMPPAPSNATSACANDLTARSTVKLQNDLLNIMIMVGPLDTTGNGCHQEARALCPDTWRPPPAYGVAMADLLNQAQIDDALGSTLGAWTLEGDDTIRRDITADTFAKGIGIVDEVAVIADAMDHHPDIDIRWTTVTFRLSTHSAGGLTDNDLRLAAEIDRLAP